MKNQKSMGVMGSGMFVAVGVLFCLFVSCELIAVDPDECCDTLEADISEIQTTLDDCCNFIPITELPFVCQMPAHYKIMNDLVFGTSQTSQGKTDGKLQAGIGQPSACPVVPAVAFGITIAADNVTVEGNNKKVSIVGENVGGVVVSKGVVNSVVNGVTVVGDAVSVAQVGVAVSSVVATVSGVSVVNVGAAPVEAITAPPLVNVGQGPVPPVAGAVVVAPVESEEVALRRSLRSKGLGQTGVIEGGGVLIEGLKASNNINGVTIQGSNVNVILRDSFISDSIEMGISQPNRGGFEGNFIIENVQITDSGINGIYTTFNQDNWILKNVQIRNSGFNGAIFEGFQNLSIIDSQIFDSGAKGLVASIRQSQNISLIGLEIFNSGDEALRVDNVQNLFIDRSLFTNYNRTSLPLAKIQDVNNGLIKNSQFMSFGGLSDGLFIRNSHGLIVDSNLVKVFNNFSSETPAAQPPDLTGNPIVNYIQQKYCSAPPTSESISGPVGINLQGGVTAAQVKNTVVSGTPSIGIAVQADSLNGIDEGVILENVLVDGAQNSGILFDSALNSAIFNSQIVNGQGDGITILGSSNTAVRGNTLTNNRAFGVRDSGLNSQIYQNFASANGANYTSNILTSRPIAGLGSLENIGS